MSCLVLLQAKIIKAKRVRVEQGSGATLKGKGKGPVQRVSIECMTGEGSKATSCVACREAKVKCECPGQKGTEKKTRRKKRAAEGSPQGKKQLKKARTESEVAPTVEEVGAIRKGIGELGRAILWRLDQLNAHLATLVELRAEEVWGPGADSDSEVDEVGDELIVLKARSTDKEKEVMKKRWSERKKDKKRAKAVREAEKAKGAEKAKEGGCRRKLWRSWRSWRKRQTPWCK